MYRIEKTDYGFRLTFGGSISADEMAQWLEESKGYLADCFGPFYVFVDMRTLIPLDPEAQRHIDEGQRLYRESGMVRSVVVLASPVIAAQFRRIGGETGIGRWERYIDSTSVPNWEEIGLEWLLKGRDPDEARAEIDTAKLNYQ